MFATVSLVFTVLHPHFLGMARNPLFYKGFRRKRKKVCESHFRLQAILSHSQAFKRNVQPNTVYVNSVQWLQ